MKNDENNNNNNFIVPIKGPRRGRVTYKTNIDSMYIYNNTTFNVRV
jgi:hypothetical protein